MMHRSLLGQLLLALLALACQPGSSQTLPPPAAPAGPVASGQPGQWSGPLRPAVSRSQVVSARLVPFWDQGKGGLMTPEGRVVVPATYPGLPYRLGGHRHLWLAPLAGAAPLNVALLDEDGQSLGNFVQVGGGQDWGWAQARTAQGTLTLFDSLGHLLRATPYALLEHKTEELVVVALPDSVPVSRAQGFFGGRRGVIDAQAREIVPPLYDYLTPYDHGYAHAVAHEHRGRRREGALDRQGRPHWLGPEWDGASLKYEGGFFAGWSNDKHAATAVDVDGRVIVPYSAKMLYIGREDSRYTGLIKVKQGIMLDGGRGAREAIGFYDSLFRPVVPPAYQSIPEINPPWIVLEGFLPAGRVDDAPRGAMYRGVVVLPAACGRVTITRDNRFAIGAICGPDGASQPVTSEHGQPPLPFPAGVQEMRYVAHGVFAARSGERWGILRADGQVLRACQDASPTTQLQAGLYYGRGTNAWGPDLADTLGRPVVPAGQYQQVSFVNADLAVVQQNGRYGIWSRACGLLVPAELPEQPTVPGTGLFAVKLGDKVIFSPDGQQALTITAPDFLPLAPVGPSLVLGRSKTREPVFYTYQGERRPTEAVAVPYGYHDGVAWARNAAGRYALLDEQGQPLTPYKYPSVLANSYQGLSQARDNANRTVYVDCRGREFAW